MITNFYHHHAHDWLKGDGGGINFEGMNLGEGNHPILHTNGGVDTCIKHTYFCNKMNGMSRKMNLITGNHFFLSVAQVLLTVIINICCQI